MLRLILPLALSFLSCSLNAQDRPEKLKGLLWEISGNGIARPGYLYGTMHVPEKLAFNLSDSFFIALQQTDIVALETDHDQWQAFTEMLEAQENEHWDGDIEQANIRQSTQGDLYNEMFAFPTPDNQLLGAILSARPRMTNEFLYRSNQYRQDYEEDTYLDLFIFQAGRKLGKKVIGLETMEGSYEAFIRSQLPDEEAENDGNRPYYPGLYDRTTIEEAYRDQDLSLLDSLNKMMSPGKNFQRWMQDERNQIMVGRIDSILQSGTALFSAVGAAHLPGETGLIRMLRQKGYTLRPVQFSAQKSKSVKDSIDALHYPVQFSRHWLADSSWSVEAPGKFFQTMEMPGLEQQLCTDMSNGAYYAVYHIETYGLWNGQSPAYIAERLDSMIYEKIPGKIQERKRISDPFPGHEITTRTRRGDIIRYKILVTPFNVFLFATGGNGNYALGKEGTQFLNSIRYNATPSAPSGARFELYPPQGGFRIRFPAAPFLNTTGDPEAKRRLAVAADPADGSVYMFYRADFHDWGYIEEDSFELNIIGENIAAAFTKKAPRIREVAGKPFPVQDVSFRSDRDSAYYFLRLAIDGPRYYLLGCRKKTDEAPLSFFESFAIEPVRYPDDWANLTDSTVMFRTKVPAPA
ncbi:MAG: TraB/GumN family protein, partial [Thermoanaerobaculia bacterium]|nr:TraB/GumN family protein [Thermoanaerobaculia bacterium]